MAVCTWTLLRLAFEDGLDQARKNGTIHDVWPEGVDVKWKSRPTIELRQDLQTFAIIVSGKMLGDIVPKRRISTL